MALPYQMLPPIKVKQFNMLRDLDKNNFEKMEYEISDDFVQPKDLY